MTSQATQETLVPVFVSQDEYNQILQQPSYLHQQLLQELYQKKQQQTQLQANLQIHPYLQLQQQTLNQSQNQNVSINIPKIPTSPNQYSQPQGYPYQNQQLQQQLLYQNQNQIQNQNTVPIVQKQHLKHASIQKAGTQERKFFYESFTSLFMVEICISLFLNTISALFRIQVVTSNYTWGPGLWAILILFILLNLFIITNSTYMTQGNNQMTLYWIHVVLYVWLLQGIQTAVSGSDRIFSWDTNYFYYFYLLICVEFISVRYAIKYKGVMKPIKEYVSYLIFPPIIAYSAEFFSQYYRFFYVPLFLWLLIVILIGFGCILLIKRLVQKGYNNFKTNHVFAMAISFPILMISPFYDDE
ncbi:unnamed protein product (macronuclear) [Paramecium tetraurelia]|uniref:Transmembrane protein n=1 Tax=Paramecium tetraurelia TaxID=5888 RepID=A0D9V5_PARTE|nr:uncharacterized protein GSPATT00014753001 [Paramecium tetraurelia]CAK79822.1 unnamed protein product [Paramecium tetraurelia]|eukprot:XP_001447219.1 hypothetical protein (macronuclear) [Paramecium tetraurelia strain d4-2]